MGACNSLSSKVITFLRSFILIYMIYANFEKVKRLYVKRNGMTKKVEKPFYNNNNVFDSSKAKSPFLFQSKNYNVITSPSKCPIQIYWYGIRLIRI